MNSWVLAFAGATAIAWLLSLRYDMLQHWFILPVVACGGLVGAEFLDFLRGRRDLFDLDVLLSAAGLHMFYVAPLGHVVIGQYMQYVTPPPDWRPWLGWMAALNVSGIGAWRLGAWMVSHSPWWPRRRSRWILARERLNVTIPALLSLSLVLQAYVYARYGGLRGYLSVFEGVATGTERFGFSGMGWVFAVSESFPHLCVIAIFGFLFFRRRSLSWPAISGLLLALIVLKLLFGGMRGSRSETVWFAFWFLGVINFTLRKVTRLAAAAAAVLALSFMYLYSFYKTAGIKGLVFLTDPESRSETARDVGRSVSRVLLGDLARADIQAFLLYRLHVSGRDIEPARGRTYLGAITAYVPSALGISRIAGKSREGTELQFGRGSYDPPFFESTVIYGLAGETILNFGPMAVPLAYFVFGAAVAAARKWLLSLSAGDSRWLLVPFCHYCLLLMLTHDFDNVLYVPAKTALLPFLAVLFSSAVVQAPRFSLRPVERADWSLGPPRSMVSAPQ